MGNILSIHGLCRGAAARFDYCRGKSKVSLHRSNRLWIKAALLIGPALVLPLVAPAQYPGQVAKPDANAPDMRAVAVYEWTGDEAHPKSARMVPICIYDGQDLNDAGVYLAQPEPLALESDVEYQLQRDGKPVGLFDIDTSAREQGGWVGYGKLLPQPHAKAAPAQVAKVDEDDDAQSDVPVLHRKHHADDSTGDSNSGSGSGSSSGSGGPAPDPDRPTLHKGGDTSGSGSGGSSGQTNSGSNSSADSSAPAPDSDRPTLHRNDDSTSTTNSSGGDTSSNDPTRPKLKKKKKDDEEAYVNDVAGAADPNRPHLIPGEFAGYGAPVVPTLFGLPIDMHQTVAVSDAVDRPEHLWNYTWANPDDEDKMQAAMEDLARSALGLDAAPAVPAKPTTRTTAAHKRSKPVPPPAPLLVEQFRVFQLAYDGGATLVLSAHTNGVGANQKFVTLIAQPDLYGGVVVLAKSVTDAASLDLTPRMRLIDAVDAEYDNRGELLFELRGTSQRQFALYRVLRGDAQRIFLSSPESIGFVAVGK
jgi:uncharacterized membrane protein YgcG